MATIKNLNMEQVDDLQEVLVNMQKVNPVLDWNFFTLPEPEKPETRQLQEVIDKLDALDRRISRIFGNSILLNGSWKDLNSDGDVRPRSMRQP